VYQGASEGKSVAPPPVLVPAVVVEPVVDVVDAPPLEPPVAPEPELAP
jgi:hypothetical protein